MSDVATRPGSRPWFLLRTARISWWMQRVTAVALIPLVIWFAITMIGLTGAL